jgi:chromosome segregation ATPase
MMKHLSPADIDQMNKSSLPLLERMDDAVGEATTVMGAVLTELMRRTLRGGISQIGGELSAFAAEQVDATIAERRPAIEQAAAEIADKTAQTTAKRIVVEEVQALESRAREADEQLASRIQETARAAERLASEAAHDLSSRLEQAARSLAGRLEQTAESLTGRIEETHKHAQQATTTTAQELTTRIHEAERSAEQRARDTARDLSDQIALAEKRAADASQAETARQVQELLDRSRKSVLALKGRLDSLESTAESLRTEAATLAEANKVLAARVAELEKPRGFFRGLMFWRND